MSDRPFTPPCPPPTPSQTVGPFFHVCLARDAQHGSLFRDAPSRIRLAVRVLDGAGVPVTDALVEIWQQGADAAGDSAFGRLASDDMGFCEFETVRPCAPRTGAPHINVCLFARGLLHHLYTRVYFQDDETLAADPVLAMIPDDRRGTLLAHVDPGLAGRWIFDIHLQGPNETVFFDA